MLLTPAVLLNENQHISAGADNLPSQFLISFVFARQEPQKKLIY